MFLSDQQKATKAQSADIKLLDLATNAIKEWDAVVSIRDEYTGKFLEESEKSKSSALPNVQELPGASQTQLKRQPALHFDASGRVYDENKCEFVNVLSSLCDH